MQNWKPEDKKAAIVFSIDDIHPGKTTDLYEAGGDLDKGALGKVKWLLNRHPELKVTLFTTADWRETCPFPTKKILAKLPKCRDKFYLAPLLKKGTMDLRNHPEFVQYLNHHRQFEVALHGLYHVHRGLKIPVEFQNQNKEEFDKIVSEMIHIFDASGINFVNGICPPGWNAPLQLLDVLVEKEINFINSSRDIFTPVCAQATCNMSGLKATSLIYPTLLMGNKLVHFPANFQANSSIERALEIIENGGLLSIKAHIIAQIENYVAIDGVTDLYMNYLDVLITILKNKYGDSLWFTSMGEITKYIKTNNTL